MLAIRDRKRNSSIAMLKVRWRQTKLRHDHRPLPVSGLISSRNHGNETIIVNESIFQMTNFGARQPTSDPRCNRTHLSRAE